MTSAVPYDALVVVSFGAPEGRDDVIPFLENVLRGRNVPRARLEEVAEHYYHFGGCSPLAAANRALVTALQHELDLRGPQLPVYFGNRNWHPLLADTLRTMQDHGVKRALAFVTSAFGSYSGCRQYLEDIARARAEVGPNEAEDAPQVAKLRLFYNHPMFLDIWRERLRAALDTAPAGARLIFTAHSIPAAMAAAGPYQRQLEECCELLAADLDGTPWTLAYQSRSGPPQQPWLEPSLETTLRRHAADGAMAVVVAPVGFLSDHMEVVYDLDFEAKALCQQLKLQLTRVRTPQDHPAFPGLIRELILERLDPARPRLARGASGPWPDACPENCCLVSRG